MEILPFMPQIKIPIVGKIINGKIKAALRDTYVSLIIE